MQEVVVKCRNHGTATDNNLHEVRRTSYSFITLPGKNTSSSQRSGEARNGRSIREFPGAEMESQVVVLEEDGIAESAGSR